MAKFSEKLFSMEGEKLSSKPKSDKVTFDFKQPIEPDRYQQLKTDRKAYSAKLSAKNRNPAQAQRVPGNGKAGPNADLWALATFQRVDNELFLTKPTNGKPLIDLLHTPTELIHLSKCGVPFDLFSQLVQFSPFSTTEWAFFLGVPEKRLSDHKGFSQAQSEIILQIAQLQKLGEDVFGDQDGFASWAGEPSIVLGGKRPTDFMDSTFGIQMLKTELHRIEFGILA